MISDKRQATLAGTMCCLLAFGLLVSTLNVQSIWWDEGISLHLAGLSWGDIVANRAVNIHPPLYFFLLKIWTGLVGNTPFAGRYFSALATTLLPACVYCFVLRRFGYRTAKVSAMLVALAPPFVVYGQEVRAYALLPPAVIALWSCVWPVSFPGSSKGRTLLSMHVRRGIRLGILQAVLALLHYAGVLAIAAGTLGFVTRWFRLRRTGARERARGVMLEWFAGAGITLLFLLPWAVLVVRVGLAGLQQQAGLGNVLAEPVPELYVAEMIGVFHAFGLPETLGMPHLAHLAACLGGLLIACGAFALSRSNKRQSLARLVALWLCPFLAAPAIWILSPQSHPRYLFAFVVGGWLVLSVLISLVDVPKLLRFASLAVALVSSMLGLRTYFTDPAVARSDVRSAAAYIRDHARDGDVALVPRTDWSLAQYDLGSASLQMVSEDMVGRLGETRVQLAAEPGARVYALDYQRGALDPRGFVRAALTGGGMLTERHSFNGVAVEVYELHQPAELPTCEPVEPMCISGADLCLVGVGLPPVPISGSAMPVALCWSRGEGSMARYGVAVRLYGPSGDFIVAEHDLLLNQVLAPTDLWSAQTSASYHVLPLPVGALPMPHKLEISLYDALQPEQSVVLEGAHLAGAAAAASVGTVTPAVVPWRADSLYGLATLPEQPSHQVSPSLSLVGARLDRDVVRPGEAFFVAMQWDIEQDGIGVAQPRLELYQDEVQIAVAESAISTLDLPSDRPLLETLALFVPPETASGDAEVVLRVQGDMERLGGILIEGTHHVFDVPDLDYAVDVSAGDVASLLGFNVTPGPKIAAGEPLTVTLVWRAAEGAADQDLKVFIHLTMSDGQMMAQDDAKPVAWSRPTSGWIADEVIVDDHALTWHTTAESGRALLRVGFYDEVTGERLVWSNGVDAYELPIELIVEAEP